MSQIFKSIPESIDVLARLLGEDTSYEDCAAALRLDFLQTVSASEVEDFVDEVSDGYGVDMFLIRHHHGKIPGQNLKEPETTPCSSIEPKKKASKSPEAEGERKRSKTKKKVAPAAAANSTPLPVPRRQKGKRTTAPIAISPGYMHCQVRVGDGEGKICGVKACSSLSRCTKHAMAFIKTGRIKGRWSYLRV